MQYVFGTGQLFAQPEGADTGATTPMQVGALRAVSVDMGFNARDLHGGPWPLAIGRGTGKVACTAEYAQLTAEGFNLLFFGGPPPAIGSTRVAVEEAHTVTGNAIAPVNASTFELDLGIVAALPAGDLFHRVAAAPGPRQYTCNESTGAYGFGGSDGQAVLVSYAYADATNGRRIDIANRNIGHTPRFSVVLTETFNGKKMTLTLNSCAASRLGFTSKMEDFTIPAFSFSAAADDAGIVGSLSLDEEFQHQCFAEEFDEGLTPYVTTSGNTSIFTVVSTPYGNGVSVASISTGSAYVQRALPSDVATRTFSAKFKVSDFAIDDGGTILVLGPGGAEELLFVPRADAGQDPLRRARLFVGAELLPVTPGSVTADAWYRLDVRIAVGAGNTVATVTLLSNGTVVQTTTFANSHSPAPAVALRLGADCAAPTSVVEFADLEIC